MALATVIAKIPPKATYTPASEPDKRLGRTGILVTPAPLAASAWYPDFGGGYAPPRSASSDVAAARGGVSDEAADEDTSVNRRATAVGMCRHRPTRSAPVRSLSCVRFVVYRLVALPLGVPYRVRYYCPF